MFIGDAVTGYGLPGLKFFLEVDKNTGHLKWRRVHYGGTVYLACEVRVMNLSEDTAS